MSVIVNHFFIIMVDNFSFPEYASAQGRFGFMRSFSARDLTGAAIGVVLIALCSWIAVPTAVPFTLQTFAVCLIAALLGLRRGLWSVGCYILLGAVGVPVFSGFRGGFGVLLGSTGGYIAGFLFTALVIGLALRNREATLPRLLVSMSLGVLLCYAFGTAWFMAVYARGTGPLSLGTALSWCVLPYLIPDAVKITMAALLARRLAPTIHRQVGI